MKPLLKGLGALVFVLLGLAAGVLLLDRAEPLADGSATAFTASAEQVERGRYLALVGHCAGCHTARAGAAYAGGRAIATPFGAVFASNLTPDVATGIGAWTAGQFWRALHHGRGADGRRLVPAFPYTEYTQVTREDSDALFAWLRTLPPVAQPNRAHELRWPYGTPLALAAWRLLFFKPAVWHDDPAQGADWNRGAYLVNGLGHCAACHGGRNALGAAGAGFGGGLVASSSWYAPALSRAAEAGVAQWPLADVVALLRTGRAPQGWANGPMAEVVQHSLQHLNDADARAMASYLRSLPQEPPAAPPEFEPPAPARLAAGAALYRDHCAGCHGSSGEGGVLPNGQTVVPALAGNRLVALEPAVNLVHVLAQGGFGAVTAANPRPFGMPPFAHVLSDEQLADLATFLRASWGAKASPVQAHEVARWRGGGSD